MDYKKMIEESAAKGGDEKVMWASVEVTSEAMEYIKEVDHDKYECLMRKLHEALHGKHYCEEMALHDVEKLHYTDASGVKHKGAHWTVEQVEAAFASKPFPAGTTKWDKFVSANVLYSDLSTVLDEKQIIAATYKFWFDDEDWEGDGKIWDYMSL